MVVIPAIEVPYQVDNPDNSQRHILLEYILQLGGRGEDLKNIIDAMSPPEDILTLCPRGIGKNIRVAVIGGGAAGLCAAFELRKTGCDITIFEASDRIGGRIYTWYFDREGKYYGDLGAMRIPPSHETTWKYINLFKLDTSPFPMKNINGLFYLRNARAVNDPQGVSVMENIYPRYDLPPDERSVPWQDLADRIYRKYLLPLPPETRRELMEVKPFYSDEIRALDMLNYRNAYEGTGLSQNAISMLGYLSTFDESYFSLGLVEILQDIYTADFYFTYRINSGTINLPMAFYRALKDEIPSVYGCLEPDELGTVHFRLNTAVDGIYESPGGDGIVLEHRKTGSFGYEFENFDYVICTIPFSSLRRLRIDPPFSIMKMQAITELNYMVAQKIFLFLKERFWEMGPAGSRIVGGSSSTDLPVISMYYPPEHAMPVRGVMNGWTMREGTSPFEPGVLLASYNIAQDAIRLGNEYEGLKIHDAKRYVERIHSLPMGYLDDKLISYKSLVWSDYQYIWQAYCLAKPEDKTLFSYVVTLPEMGGKVFFAGEHISQKHAWIQGALKTAMKAANDVAREIVMKRK